MRGNFCVISVDHHLADISIREQFNFSTVEIEAFYVMLREVLDLHEVLILNTCNRVELYFYSEKTDAVDVAKLLCAFKSVSLSDYQQFIRTEVGTEAITHLHRVAIGLESMVIGDLQIMGQVKQAYQQSVDHDMAGPVIHRLLHRVFYCHKHVNQETTFKCGAASISYNAASLIFKSLADDANVLVVGAGQMASDLASHLSKKGYQNIVITNRSKDKATALASQFGYDIIDFESHQEKLSEYDAVISTIAVDSVVYPTDVFENTSVQLIIDMSSPRSVDARVNKLPIQFWDIDALGQQVDKVIEQRKKQIPTVEHLIEASVIEFNEWKEGFEFTSGVSRFKSTLQELQRQSLQSKMKSWSKQERELAEEVTSAMIQKIVNLPVKQIKNVCKREEAEQLSNSLNELFNIEYVNS